MGRREAAKKREGEKMERQKEKKRVEDRMRGIKKEAKRWRGKEIKKIEK